MAEERMEPPPKRLGHFEILPQIAEGGMGVLHLARQPELDRLVVLKRMRREIVGDPSMVARFEREARAAAAVQHQNVVAVYDCFQHRGDHYIAQEFVDGVDLSDLLDEAKRIDADIAARIALAVALGLEEVHSRGIIHRDLKPSNVLLGFGGEVKIADFGIAVERSGPGLTQPGTMLGSLPYMSPEQMMGEHVDYRSDLFTFGILLYEMITGSPPFRESLEGSPDTLLERMQRGRFISPRRRGAQAPRWMVRMIRRCLRPKAADRPQSATELRRLLERRVRAASPADSRHRIAAWLNEHGFRKENDSATTVSPIVASSVRRPPSRRLLWAASAAAALALAALMVAAGMRLSRATAPGPELAEPDSIPVSNASTWAAAEPGPVSSAVPDAPDLLPMDSLDAETSSPSADVENEIAAAPVLEPAAIRFVAAPWATVTIDDEPAFHTPRAAPVVLVPGRHVVVFEHPAYGRAETVLELSAGERRTVRHDFVGGESS
jgi:serine/threonine-protein kinase